MCIITDNDKILNESEYNDMINMISSNQSSDETNISIMAVPFDYYRESLNNVALLSYVYESYRSSGHNAYSSWLATSEYFAKKVRSGGDWDYKRFLGTSTRYYCDFNGTSGTYDGESIGNMMYGTVGSYLFKSSTLKAAAGVYQITSGTSRLSWFSTYFDDPADQNDIERGIYYHGRFNFPNRRYR